MKIRFSGNVLALIAVGLWLAAGSALAATQTTVGAGSVMELGNGELDLCCTDLLIEGRVEIVNGRLRNVRTIRIAPTGTLIAGNGQIEIGGSFENEGNFVEGTSVVSFVDLPCAVANRRITGANRFATLIVRSNTGQSLSFPAGLTQTVTQHLELKGTPALALPLLGAPAGTPWNLNLLANATQDISDVSVADSVATGQHLAPTQTNRGTGSAVRWFLVVAKDVPVHGAGFSAILLAISTWLHLRRVRSRRRQSTCDGKNDEYSIE